MPNRTLLIGKESSYGSAATMTEAIPLIEENLALERSFEKISALGFVSPQAMEATQEIVRGDITVSGDANSLGLLFKAFFGTNEAPTGGPPYDHVFPATAGTTGRDGISLTIEVYRHTSMVHTFAGCKIVGFTLSASQSQAPQVTFSVIGKSEATSGSPSSVSPPAYSKLGRPTISFDAAALSCAELSVTAAWPVAEDLFAMGTTALIEEPVDTGLLEVTGEAVCFLSDFTQYAKFDGTDDVDVLITSTAGSNSLKLNMNKARLTAAASALSGRDRVRTTFGWESIYDATATENLQIELDNDDATIP